MIADDAEWMGNAPAPQSDLDRLRRIEGIDLPEDYLRFLGFSDGGEGPLGIEPGCVVIDPAASAASQNEEKVFEEFFPGFFFFGGNGAGELLAFDLRGSKPWPIVMIDMTNIDLDESVVQVADDFSAFLEQIGYEMEPRQNQD